MVTNPWVVTKVLYRHRHPRAVGLSPQHPCQLVLILLLQGRRWVEHLGMELFHLQIVGMLHTDQRHLLQPQLLANLPTTTTHQLP